MIRSRSLCLVAGLLLLGGALAGCSRANRAAMSAWSMEHHIKQYSGDKLIGEWCSTGKINSETHSDGKYFEDLKTKKLVMISGHVVIVVGCPDHTK
jgi:hypothetical protein